MTLWSPQIGGWAIATAWETTLVATQLLAEPHEGGRAVVGYSALRVALCRTMAVYKGKAEIADNQGGGFGPPTSSICSGQFTYENNSNKKAKLTPR